MEQSFSVLTYNVNFAGGRHEHESTADSIVLNAVVEAAADVVLMQETHVGWEALISQRAELAQAYPHRFFMDDGMKSAGGQSILSKVPVLQQREIKAPVQGSWFRIWLGEFDFGERTTWIASVHLRPPLDDDGTAGLLTMTRTSHVRRQELEHLLLVLEDQGEDLSRVIVAGDFNETDRHNAMDLMREHGFRDALALTSGHTHWWPLTALAGTQRVVLRSRLDHAMYGAAFECLGCEIRPGCEGNSSDHLPVLVRFRHNAENAAPVKDSLGWYTGSTLGIGSVLW
jgi:endonuclease/exonuclease/phosphatase (EEP) superfamily protein YafD